MDDLVQGASAMGIALTKDQQEKFAIFLRELKAYNEHTNLTAIRDDAGIIKKHFLDSLSVLQAIPETARTLIDIGSGPGFPGLPIAIMKPELHVTLLEVTAKKTAFLNHIVQTLGLTNVTVVTTRAEEAAKENNFREQFDVATARAVAELRTLVEYAMPFIKVGGIFIAQKMSGQTEIDEAQNAISVLGGTLNQTISLQAEERQLIVIKKIKPTPAEYPRRIGLATKKPL